MSCVVNAEIAEADLALHALPLYHCAQLDVFFGPAIYIGSTNVITAKPVPDHLLPLIAKHRITSFFAPPTVWIALLRSPLCGLSDDSLLQLHLEGRLNLGALLREVASRDAPALMTVRSGIPEPVSTLVTGLLARTPADRPAHAASVAATLSDLAQRQQPHALHGGQRDEGLHDSVGALKMHTRLG